MKICLFGGTFDPPHLGHLLIAQSICESEGFDKVLFIPAFKPPHKVNISNVTHRVNMLNLAIKDNPKFELSNIEIQRKGISYAIDTILGIKELMNIKSSECYYLMGSDSLIDLNNWKDPLKILDECKVVVAARPGFQLSKIEPWILKKIQFANIPKFELSSTNIRKRWFRNLTIRYMVTLPVWEYINDKSLYIN